MTIEVITSALEDKLKEKFFPFENEQILFNKLETEGYSFGKWFPEENGFKSCYCYSTEKFIKYIMCLWNKDIFVLVANATPENNNVIPVIVSNRAIPTGIQAFISDIQKSGNISFSAAKIYDNFIHLYNPFLQNSVYAELYDPKDTLRDLSEEEVLDLYYLAGRQRRGHFLSGSARTKTLFIAIRKIYASKINKVNFSKLSEKKKQNLKMKVIKDLWSSRGHLIEKGFFQGQEKFDLKYALSISNFTIKEILENYFLEDILMKYIFEKEEKHLFFEDIYRNFIPFSKLLFEVKGENIIAGYQKRYNKLPVYSPKIINKQILKSLNTKWYKTEKEAKAMQKIFVSFKEANKYISQELKNREIAEMPF